MVIPESKKRRYTEPRLTHQGEIFRALLRHTRETKGLNQSELAERLGMSQVLISRCEVGDRKVDVLELCRDVRGDGSGRRGFCQEIKQGVTRT